MKKSIYTFLMLFVSGLSLAQSTEALRQHIQQITSTKKAVVGVSVSGNGGKDTLSVLGDRHFPMQSVFKFHIAVAMLSAIDKGQFSLQQPIKITEKDLTPNIWSPLRETYPNGVTLPLADIIRYTVSQSDNVGCDLLLKLLGGPLVVETYFKDRGFSQVSIKINEETMQNDWDLQFQNWTTPKAATDVLQSVYANDKNRLSETSHTFLWKTMRETETGPKRLKGNLPPGTTVAHKTGYSGTNKDGITAAVNDVGVVFLPNGNSFFISVFVTDSIEDIETNERIIADVAKAAWDYFSSPNK